MHVCYLTRNDNNIHHWQQTSIATDTGIKMAAAKTGSSQSLEDIAKRAVPTPNMGC